MTAGSRRLNSPSVFTWSSRRWRSGAPRLEGRSRSRWVARSSILPATSKLGYNLCGRDPRVKRLKNLRKRYGHWHYRVCTGGQELTG
ncbi:MAG TPA: hypothetical protein VMW24_24225, partial [Sedimentisphaerales bacterium]|nr:hypothetical protein [Sedimentisphaerales bacterium]